MKGLLEPARTERLTKDEMRPMIARLKLALEQARGYEMTLDTILVAQAMSCCIAYIDQLEDDEGRS